tara:strand:+ start:1199 stop:1891 length:693 start_codon:yes stop_codon:yes gene_type:complete
MYTSPKKQLVQAHHLAARLGLDDTIFTHLSVRCQDHPGHFYLTPFGRLFQEIDEDSLLTLNLDGTLVKGNNALNTAGSLLHSALYQSQSQTNCVIHLHSPAALAVSCLKEGLLPLTQFSMIFYNRLGYHPFEGISLDPAEKSRLLKSLGPHKAMLLHNHGLLTVAESVSQAFMTAYYLERSCEIQIRAQSTGRPLILPSPEVCEKTAQQFEGPEYTARDRAWQALVQALL